MSQQVQGSISENELMRKLVNAKKVMNKIDSGNFERGHINENVLFSDPMDLVNQEMTPTVNKPVSGTPSIDRIQNSKLPDAIKRAMIENPISQISLNDNIDMDFLKGAKRLMEQEGLTKKSPPPQPKPLTQNSSKIDMDLIASLIENTVRKVMDEKLNEILTAQQTSTINENLVLKVGDSIFRGKITGVNKAK